MIKFSHAFVINFELTTEFGNEADTSGWLMAAYALGYAATAVIAGKLTVRRDRKKVLIAGIAAATPSIQPPDADSERVSFLSTYGRILRRAEGRFAYPAHFFYFFGMFGALTYVGNWMSDEFGLDVSEIGLLVVTCGMGNLTGNLLGSRIVARWGPRTVLFASQFAIGVSYAAAPALHKVAAAALLLLVSRRQRRPAPDF
jgi:predicted MFS family arabinose efflux permease